MRPVLITAGATRNPIDAMRVIAARSSGTTGAWLAERLQANMQVHFLGSPEACLRAPVDVTTEVFDSTRDLMARMEHWVNTHPRGVVIHAAAVGDYEAAEAQGKIPSGKEELIIRLKPTPKIIDHICRWSSQVRLVSFKAAAPGTSNEQLQAVATAQRQRTDSQLVFANVLGQLDRDVLLVGPNQSERFARRNAALEALAKSVLQFSE